LFGCGDFSRTFLIVLASRGLGETSLGAQGVLTSAVLLYALHNAVSAAVAFPIGQAGDRGSKLRVLVLGYFLGVVTNGLLAGFSTALPWLITAIVLFD
jgi:hypothetical protein